MAVEKKDNFITLKEAADMSGYSSDYLGQLIRSGKLQGEQVYMNVAWMTTREAVEEYVTNSKTKTKKAKDEEATNEVVMETKQTISEIIVQHWVLICKVVLYAVIGITIVFIVLLFHVGSFSVEKRFEQRDQLRQTSVYNGDYIRTLYA